MATSNQETANVTYREGDCWSAITLDEFSVCGILPHVQYDIDASDGQYNITIEHIRDTGMTIITYFNSDGESRNWIAPTNTFVDYPGVLKDNGHIN